MSDTVRWPPAWNPFHVFLLALCLASSIGLIQGNSGSQVLDDRLNDLAVSLWGAALAVGSLLALGGVACYAVSRGLVPGLYLERAGLLLVGGAATIYTVILLTSAADVTGVRYTATVQTAFAAASFFRAWQSHRAIALTHQVYRNLNSGAPE
jgi:hypothetical protein